MYEVEWNEGEPAVTDLLAIFDSEKRVFEY